MKPDDTTTTSNGEEQLTSVEAAERAADQAEDADIGRGGSQDRHGTDGEEPAADR